MANKMHKVEKKEVSINELYAEMQKGFERQEKIMDDKIDKFALMIAKGFEHVDKRFDEVDQRFEQVDQRFEQVDRRFAHMEATLSTMQRDVEEIQREMVYKDEMEDLMARVKYVEMKLGIESGK